MFRRNRRLISSPPQPHQMTLPPAQLQKDWAFYIAYNLFRLAAILQGIAKRVEMGTASSAKAKDSAAGAKPLAELGWAMARTYTP